MASRVQWERRHCEAASIGSPSPFLVEVLDLLPEGRCLDVACGRGANALFLAARGFEVEAIDWSAQALRTLGRLAAQEGLTVRAVAADLQEYPLPSSRYDVLLCMRYLDRGLWPSMVRALRPGGALLYETMTLAHLVENPSFPEKYCLRPGELLTAFEGVDVALYRELPGSSTASLLAFKR